jgi:hypothetical protein
MGLSIDAGAALVADAHAAERLARVAVHRGAAVEAGLQDGGGDGGAGSDFYGSSIEDYGEILAQCNFLNRLNGWQAGRPFLFVT